MGRNEDDYMNLTTIEEIKGFIILITFFQFHSCGYIVFVPELY